MTHEKNRLHLRLEFQPVSHRKAHQKPVCNPLKYSADTVMPPVESFRPQPHKQNEKKKFPQILKPSKKSLTCTKTKFNVANQTPRK